MLTKIMGEVDFQRFGKNHQTMIVPDDTKEWKNLLDDFGVDRWQYAELTLNFSVFAYPG